MRERKRYMADNRERERERVRSFNLAFMFIIAQVLSEFFALYNESEMSCIFFIDNVEFVFRVFTFNLPH